MNFSCIKELYDFAIIHKFRYTPRILCVYVVKKNKRLEAVIFCENFFFLVLVLRLCFEIISLVYCTAYTS
jgi:hypothetical protein